MIERSRVRIPAGTAGEFSSPGSTFCADSYFGIRSTPVLPQCCIMQSHKYTRGKRKRSNHLLVSLSAIAEDKTKAIKT